MYVCIYLNMDINIKLLITAVEDKPVSWDKTAGFHKERSLYYFERDFETLFRSKKNKFGKCFQIIYWYIKWSM